jgi:predicted ATPase/DNA-binding winged helix-turn-helix (wHTH) protein
MALDIDREEELRFGSYRLFPVDGFLLHGDRPIRIPPRELDVLIAVVKRRGEIAARDQIFREVWGQTAVEDGALSVAISALRHKRGLHPTLIETVPGRGYRLTEAVRGAGDISSVDLKEDAKVRGPGAATNLPRRPNPLIGRDTELHELLDRLDGYGSVAILGPAGIGKTSLALAVGGELLARRKFPDGVWLIDLAPVCDPALIESAIATVIGIKPRSQELALDAIVRTIGDKQMLLIFDNCEYVVQAAARIIGALLSRCARSKILATSQVVLSLADMAQYRLESLDLPPPARDRYIVTAADIEGYAAVELFSMRARAADRRFRLDDACAASVAEICRMLDGIPLALELAAAEVPRHRIAGLRAKLAAPQRWLHSGPSNAPARYRTLQAMLDWSYGLLGPEEQRLYRRLGIFRGSFSLAASLAVGRDADVEDWELADTLDRLIDKSLVFVGHEDPPRYRVLETVRLDAQAKLRSSGEQDSIAERHARYYCRYFQDSDRAWRMMRDDEWDAIYAPELNNVRAALDFALGDPQRWHDAVVLAGRSGYLWYRLGLWQEGQRYMAEAVDKSGISTPLIDAAMLFQADATLWGETDAERGLRMSLCAIELFRQIDDPGRLGTLLSNMTAFYTALGRLDETESLLMEAWSLLEGSSLTKSCGNAKSRLAILATRKRKYTEARKYYSESLRYLTREFSPANHYMTLLNLGHLTFMEGDLDDALKCCWESVDGFRELGNQVYLGMALANLAAYLALSGNEPAARQYAAEAIPLLLEERGPCLRDLLELWAFLWALAGQHREAAKLEGFIAADFDVTGEVREPIQQSMQAQLQDLLDLKFSNSEVVLLYLEGSSWTLDQAIDFVRTKINVDSP